MKDLGDRIYTFLSSARFFRTVIVFFVFESAWIALSAVYPQAFDESFHFGLIQTYSHHWLPFLSSQPPDSNAFGAVARDPSYLYHYLMSFPYRLVAHFVHGQNVQVIILRLIDTGLFATGLILFRKILLRVGLSRAMASLSILLFALIPIVPQLSSQINYDNLLFPLVACTILLAFNVMDQLRAHKPRVNYIVGLISLCFFTSIVKYAFLPIFLAVGVFLTVVLYKAYRHKISNFFADLLKDIKKTSVKSRIILATLLIVSFGMFAQRDLVNIYRYGTVAPSCSTVLSVDACKAYSPWYYDYTNHNLVVSQKAAGTASYKNIVEYAIQWLYWMWYRLFFAVNGPASQFTNYPPLPLPYATAILVFLIGLAVCLKWWRRIFKNNLYLVLLFAVSAVYLAVLFAQGYSTYHYTDVLENMNGRYLLPVLLFLVAILARALSLALRYSVATKVVLAAAIVLLFLQGGGFLTFISRSDDSWDMNNSVVQKVNDTTRKITNPVLVNGRKEYNTSLWFFN